MKSYIKGLLVGIFLTISCVGFMASKSNQVGRYELVGTVMFDNVTGTMYIKEKTTINPYLIAYHWKKEIWIKEG